MAYEPNEFGYKDALPSGDPDKVIKGSDFDVEFNAIKEALDSVDVEVNVDDVNGLEELLDEKADKSDLEQEIQHRISGDAALQGQIDNFENYDDAEIRADLAQETQDRIAGDAALQVDINNLRADLGHEEQDRIDADQVLESALAQETADRKEGDQALQGNIDGVSASLSQEIRDRQNGDIALGDRIDNLVTDDLADVNSENAKLDQFLIYNGSQWVAEDFHIDTELTYQGGISVVSDPAPSANNGDLYINNEAGTVGASWTGIAGKTITAAVAVGWSTKNARWYMLGDIASAAVMRVEAGLGIDVDDTKPAEPVVSIDRTETDKWYAPLWEQNGNDIYYNKGHVGIGTDDPSHALDVTAKSPSFNPVRFSGHSSSIDAFLYTDSSYWSIGDAESYGGNLWGGHKANDYVHAYTAGIERMRIDAVGRVGIGGEPSRSTKEIEDDAVATLAAWDSKDKKPTKAELIKRLTERNIGGGSAMLQVAGDGYFSGRIKTADAVDTIVLNAWSSAGYIQFQGSNILEWRNNLFFPYTTASVDLGTSSKKFKDGHFSGTIYGNVDDVPSHVKNITPTQIANWDAGTGGGGGATTDGRISDTQITNWDHAYDWGNHASAGYQPAGNYADANHNHSGVYQPVGNYLTPSSLNGYATESWVSSNYQPKGSYLTSADLNGYATQAWVTGQGYATQSWVTGQGYLTSASLNGYATQSWVQSQNYLTSASLSGYATESWVSTNYQPKGSYALVGSSYTKAESDGKYELKGEGGGGLPDGDWICEGSIYAKGNVSAYYASDERLKDDITAMPIGLIDSIKPVTWRWKESGKDSGGVVAQQLQECGLEDWVNEAPNGDLGVDYNALIGVLLAEVQDLKLRVKELEG